jgi:LmbE family N-acetylglucosaminyl deacetylase
MKILLAPHPDDEALFNSYYIMRNKPLVVIITHPTLQGNNGYERLEESYKAMRLLDVPVMFLGIPEHLLTEDVLEEKLRLLKDTQDDESVRVPSHEDDGNPQHNLVNKVAKKVFGDLDYGRIHEYKTYGGDVGKEVEATKEEKELKMKVLSCYQTQINNKNCSHYFETLKEYE